MIMLIFIYCAIRWYIVTGLPVQRFFSKLMCPVQVLPLPVCIAEGKEMLSDCPLGCWRSLESLSDEGPWLSGGSDLYQHCQEDSVAILDIHLKGWLLTLPTFPSPDVSCKTITLTCFTHHRGNKLGDNGAPLSHLALFAVREVWENTCDASGTGCPASVHHDQHLHYGGVHIPDKGEGHKKTKEDNINTWCYWEASGETGVFFLTWTLSGSQKHLCLEPTPGSVPVFLWKQQGCEKKRAERKDKHTLLHRGLSQPCDSLSFCVFTLTCEAGC